MGAYKSIGRLEKKGRGRGDEILFCFQEREYIQTAEGKKAAVWNVQ